MRQDHQVLNRTAMSGYTDASLGTSGEVVNFYNIFMYALPVMTLPVGIVIGYRGANAERRTWERRA